MGDSAHRVEQQGQDALFDSPATGERHPVAGEHRTGYLAGMLKWWTLGDGKETAEQKAWFHAVAAEAIREAGKAAR